MYNAVEYIIVGVLIKKGKSGNNRDISLSSRGVGVLGCLRQADTQIRMNTFRPVAVHIPAR